MQIQTVISTALVLGAYVPTVKSLLQGARMNPWPWFVWTVLAIVSFVASAISGFSNWLALAYVAGAGIVAIISYVKWQGSSSLSLVEKLCFLLSGCCALAGGLVFVEHFIHLMTVATLLAGVPALVDAYREPYEYNKLSWLMWSVAAGMSWHAHRSGVVSEWIFPAGNMFFAAIMLVIIEIRRIVLVLEVE